MANEEEAAQLANLQKARKFVVLAAIVLLVLSLLRPSALFIYPRSALWLLASGLSAMEAVRLKRLGVASGNAWINTALYFAVALLPLIRPR